MPRRSLTSLLELPNIGPAVAGKLRQAGIRSPQALAGRDPYVLFEKLCRVTGKRHDPCLLDTFIAATRYMAGDLAKPWWAYTAERKRKIAGKVAKKR
ncbi:MAG: helix-hairpin-helix domain-containing protein [Burkholderiales bacterium]|nr:helix-hairpin-helix domain-containing protein [Phycisphaerae bacterium]